MHTPMEDLTSRYEQQCNNMLIPRLREKFRPFSSAGHPTYYEGYLSKKR